MTTLIICSIDDARFNQTAQMYRRFWPVDQLQILHIKSPRSLAQGYNQGLAVAGGDNIILSHDDIEILSPDLAQRVSTHLSHFDIVGVAGTTLLGHPRWLQAGPPHIFGQVAHPDPEVAGYVVDIYSASCRVVGSIQALDGVFLAMRREVAQAIKFDEATFDGFHLYDLDFTFRAYQAGFKLAVACDIQLLHHSIGNYDDTWKEYGRRFLDKHLSRLSPMPPKNFLWAWAKVSGKDQIREVMTPIVWDEPE